MAKNTPIYIKMDQKTWNKILATTDTDLVPKATGLGNNYYRLPKGATEIQDLIEHKKMPFSIGNIFKACYRIGEKPSVSREYDLEKIIWFANRELNLLKD